MISKLQLPIFKKKKIDIKKGDFIGSNTHNTAMFHKYSPRFLLGLVLYGDVSLMKLFLNQQF